MASRTSSAHIGSTTLAYSYVRFSHPDQATGDSARRQDDAATDWCERNRVTLDTSLSLRDLGVSAFRGKQRNDKHCLGYFLQLVKDGRVPRGSYLIIENLDRLSREEERAALRVWMDLLDAGVNIVQLTPETIFRHEKSDMFDIMRAIMELSRGHSESRIKSERLSEVWGQKKKKARKDCSIATARVPHWLRVVGRKKEGKHIVGGRFEEIADRVRVVRRIFQLCNSGHGLSLIVKILTEEKIPCWGVMRTKLVNGEHVKTSPSGWSKCYVHKILTNRTVLGEYQPKNGRSPDGAAIKDYYPRIVADAVFDRAQSALAKRKDCPGRIGEKVASLFSGLVYDAQTHGRMVVAMQTRSKRYGNRKTRLLRSAESMEGRAPSVSFPYDVFEAAVLQLLREIPVAEIIGAEAEGESASIAREVQAKEQRLRAIEAELTGDGDVPALARAAKKLDEELQALLIRLRLAQQREANPRSAACAEAKTLLDLASDEGHRIRLRGLLRDLIESVWVQIVPRRSHRLAVVQVHFVGGSRRDYLIHYWGAGYCREGGWRVCAAPADPADNVDLRRPDDVERVGRWLATVDLDALS